MMTWFRQLIYDIVRTFIEKLISEKHSIIESKLQELRGEMISVKNSSEAVVHYAIKQVMSDFNTRLHEISNKLSELEGDTNMTKEGIEDLGLKFQFIPDVDHVTTTLQSIESSISTHNTEIQSLREAVEGVGSRINSITTFDNQSIGQSIVLLDDLKRTTEVYRKHHLTTINLLLELIHDSMKYIPYPNKVSLNRRIELLMDSIK